MSELNKIAREYLESLGVEVPAVQDAAPKTFDTQDRRNKAVPAPPAAAAPRKVTVTRALGAPCGKGIAKIPDSPTTRHAQVTVTRAIPVTMDRGKFERELHGGYVPDAEEDYRRVKQATRLMIEEHILDVKAERRAAEEYKDAREMWDAINFQPLPIAAEEVVAPRAWRVWPTGSEIRALILVGIFVLSVVAYFVMRNS
jgi:hypothetical protein